MAGLHSPTTVETRRFRLMRTSAVPYLGLLMATAMTASWANYLASQRWPEGFAIKGQSLGIVLPILLFPLALALWIAYDGRRSRNWASIAFLAGLAIAWLVHMAITRSHGDQYPHTVWLFIPVLIMIYLKMPSSSEAWQTILVFAWLALLILIATRVAEILGLVPMFSIGDDIVAWEKERYWLPLSDLFGIDGRWPGPFGYNSKTGFIAAAVVIIGLARRSPGRWVLVGVGLVVLLLTASRGSFLSTIAGLFILAVFTNAGPIARIPKVVRVSVAGVVVIIVGYLMFSSPLASTGRFGEGGIWTSFLALWQTSPTWGVGQVGILADPRAGVAMEAHNLFIQHLTRFGIVGFILQYLVIALALALMALAAYRGLAWPLALATAYYVASITEVFQDGWLQHTTYSLILILCALGASAYLTEDRKSAPRTTTALEKAVGLAGTPAD